MTGVSPAVPAQRLSALAALQHRDFAVYALARFCATLSWQILGAAVGYQLYQLTHDPLALAFVGLAQFLPFVLCVLPAGQVADRFDRRMVLICAYSVEATCAAVLLWFTMSGIKVVWPIFLAMTFFGAGRAFWMPAGQAITPNLVPRAAFPERGGREFHAVPVWRDHRARAERCAAAVGRASGVHRSRCVVARGGVAHAHHQTGERERDAGSVSLRRSARRPALRLAPSHGARRDLARPVRGAVRRRHGDVAHLRE